MCLMIVSLGFGGVHGGYSACPYMHHATTIEEDPCNSKSNSES